MSIDVATTLHDRAVRVIPGGVNSGQRQLQGIADLGVVAASGRRSPTSAVASTRTITRRSARRSPGHADPGVDRAFAETARRIDIMGVGITDLEVELAEKLVEIVPSFERVLLTLTGTEATFHAVRLARAATGRQMLVKFQGCYHGWHDAVAMNVISPAAALGGRDPSPEASCQASSRPRSCAAGTTSTTSARPSRPIRTTWRRCPRADPAQHRRGPATARLPRGPARAV